MVQILANRLNVSIAALLGLIVLLVALLVLSTSYFNSKEIQLLTAGCSEQGGETVLEIHNPFTTAYSFECR